MEKCIGVQNVQRAIISETWQDKAKVTNLTAYIKSHDTYDLSVGR